MPSKLAHPRKIVTILSEDQISAINEYRKECILPIEFRDALGHQDPTTVNTYLTYDEVHMRNRKLAESLSDTLIEYQKIQKWDGKLPTVSGSNALVSIDPAE